MCRARVGSDSSACRVCVGCIVHGGGLSALNASQHSPCPTRARSMTTARRPWEYFASVPRIDGTRDGVPTPVDAARAGIPFKRPQKVRGGPATELQLRLPSHSLHSLISSKRLFPVLIVPSSLNRVRELPCASPWRFLDVYSPASGHGLVGLAFMRCIVLRACAAARSRTCSAAGTVRRIT